jgi:hypothetical protein
MARCIALHSKCFGEVWELKHGRCGECTLKRTERLAGVLVPIEATLLGELGQWSRERAVVMYKPTVITRMNTLIAS